jgi:BolA protein
MQSKYFESSFIDGQYGRKRTHAQDEACLASWYRCSAAIRLKADGGNGRSSVMSIQSRIEDKLRHGLQPVRLEVINESHLHAGHHGSPGTGESHFRVLVISSLFIGKSRVDRHRLINEILAPELRAGVHALAIKAYAPGEKSAESG